MQKRLPNGYRSAAVGVVLIALISGCAAPRGGLPPIAAADIVEAQQQQKEKTVLIVMKTSKGDIKLELDRENAPKTVDNFLGYVESGHYTGTIFHRVIDGFMIQGGGFDEQLNQKPAPDTVENEAANGLSNVIGTIAMARTAAPHSAGAQFFINVNNNTPLDYPAHDGWGYCVFGRVVEGMETVDAIRRTPTRSMGPPFTDLPVEAITIREVSVLGE